MFIHTTKKKKNGNGNLKNLCNMIKDETQINFRIKKSYTGLIVLVIVLAILQFWQWSSTRDFRSQNKELTTKNETLETSNLQLSERVKTDSLIIVKNDIKIDSFKQLDKIRVYQLTKISKKYEKLELNYNIATTNDKWDIFTRTINN